MVGEPRQVSRRLRLRGAMIGYAAGRRVLGTRGRRAREQLAVAHDTYRRESPQCIQVAMPGLHDGRHDRGAGRVQHRLAAGVAHDLVVRGHRRSATRKGMASLHASGGLHSGRDATTVCSAMLRGHLALGVATHAVGQHETGPTPACSSSPCDLNVLGDGLPLRLNLEDGELHGRTFQAAADREPCAARQCRSWSSVPPCGAFLSKDWNVADREADLTAHGELGVAPLALSQLPFCSANTDCGRESGSSDMHHSTTSMRLSEQTPRRRDREGSGGPFEARGASLGE